MLSRRPVLKMLLPLIAGIMLSSAVADKVCTPILLAASLPLFILVVLFLRRSWNLLVDLALIFILILAGFAAGACSTVRSNLPIPPEKSPLTVIFQVRDFCERIGDSLIRVEGKLLQVEEQGCLVSCRQPIQVYLKGGLENPCPGDVVVGNGKLSFPDNRKNPGGISREESLRRRGLIWIFHSEKGEWRIISFEGTDEPEMPTGIRLRKKVGSLIEMLFSDRDEGLLKGVLLGARSGLTDERKKAFSRAGIYHILAISGLHVGIISGALLLIFSIIRFPPLLRVAALVPALFIYGSMTGMKPSIRRATIMMISVTLATSLQRKVDLVNILYAVALLLLFLSPSTIRDTGFQMSFLATWGILSLYPGFETVFDKLPAGNLPPVRWTLRILAVSICAQVPLVPVIASSFHTVSLVAPFTNLIALPIMGLLFPSGLLSVCTQWISPFLSESFAEVTSVFITILYKISDVMSGLSFAAIRISPFDPVWIAAYYFLLFFLSQAVGSRFRWEILLIFTLLAGNVRIFSEVFRSKPPMRVTFLDMGQGDGAVFEFPTGEVMIMDGGPWRREWDPGERILEPFMLERGIDRIDMMAFSHPQMDHIGGLPYLLDRYDVEAVFDPGQPSHLFHYSAILQRSLEKGVYYCLPRRGDSFSIGRAKILFLHPTEAWFSDYPGQDEVNELSLVARIDFGEVSFLMTGDIGSPAEEELVACMGSALRVDVLKVPHHGSRMSSTDQFLDAVSPDVAVISVGKYNTFGHPSPSILQRLEGRDIEILRTDVHGALVFVVEENRFEVFNGANDMIMTSDLTDRQARAVGD
jgi:competence protein ComEC